jgi:hypothetical protein
VKASDAGSNPSYGNDGVISNGDANAGVACATTAGNLDYDYWQAR